MRQLLKQFEDTVGGSAGVRVNNDGQELWMCKLQCKWHLQMVALAVRVAVVGIEHRHDCSIRHLIPTHCAAVFCRYIKFDTFHPAVSKGLPVTRVISRITLQVGGIV
jgi:hypothetical protein